MPFFNEAKVRRDTKGRFIEKPWQVARKRLLGDSKDTKERWMRWSPVMGREIYRDSRRPLHDEIVVDMLEGIEPVEGRPPRVTFLVGGAGAGKTTVLENLGEGEGSVHADGDAIKERLPEFRQLVKAGDRAAASLVHEESIDIRARLQAEAVERGLDLLVDGTGAHSRFLSVVKDFQHRGYEVDLLWVTVDTETAFERVQARAKQTGRQLSENIVRVTHRASAQNVLPIALGDPNLRRVRIFENDNQQRLVYERNGLIETDVDKEALMRIVKKGQEGQK